MNNNLENNRRVLAGLFSDRDNAEKAYEDLKDCGYEEKDINIVMTSDTRKKHFDTDGEDNDDSTRTEMGNKAMEGAGKGGAIGGVIGGIGGALAAIGTSLLIPGLGLLIAGPLAAGLAGAGAGSITGGIIGALIGAGIPEDRAKLYDEGLKDGKILLTVKLKNDEDAVSLKNKWLEYQAEEVDG